MRRLFLIVASFITISLTAVSFYWPGAAWLFVVILPLIGIGMIDISQKSHAIRRNFPLMGHFRYILEMIRPEINQYFIESDTDGTPFSRVMRSMVYQRAKAVNDTIPFGTKLDVYSTGYKWINHSLAPQHVNEDDLRVTIGGPLCQKPYSSSIFNISAMSFGSLSRNAVLALNKGAKMGGFAQDTGEGGLSPYHLQHGGDIIWEIGTGYFGCRQKDGKFDPSKFQEKANLSNIKMLEIKLSQGAKPGHGGILPAAKLTREIAEIRGVPMGQDVLSPPAHSAFSNPVGMMEFVQKLRQLSGGKPVGIKFCLGKRREFIAICKAMVVSKIMPDFIVVDGGEGGTGAAPLEFSNYVGTPLRDAMIFVHNCLVGFDLRKHIRLIVSGKVVSGFDIVEKIALGADICNAARAMMMALGCIQALRCQTNRCPTGVTTQDPALVKGLVVDDKATRVYHYHRQNVKTVAELVGAMGLSHTREVRPWHVLSRISQNQIQHYGELYKFVEPGAFLGKSIPADYLRAFEAARADSWHAQSDKRLAII